MVVVAIVAILAGIAVPNFVEMQLKAKQSEALVNAPAIAKAVRLYADETGGFPPSCWGDPRSLYVVDKHAVPWLDGCGGGWGAIGWEPDGHVRGAYTIEIISECGDLDGTYFDPEDPPWGAGRINMDIDGDGNQFEALCCSHGIPNVNEGFIYAGPGQTCSFGPPDTY